MACEQCERHRKEMALMLEACKRWSPTGPGVYAIYVRLRNEAYERGEFDDPVRPRT